MVEPLRAVWELCHVRGLRQVRRALQAGRTVRVVRALQAGTVAFAARWSPGRWPLRQHVKHCCRWSASRFRTP
ncbi:hypothetical protein AAU01_36870 [Paenarthrobacter aurescens]|uniref:Uncharacterized protein n=1 Tax=Paenarthrobacter aurescens TaxID=43663 RepID=A0A4Y3NGV8_PAEAU|nr:hypothetical protein AAU01_36870 [Paenarthrobacter aurescens]